MIWLGFAALGLTAGVLSGLLGIGGAILIIPVLVYAFKFTQHQAQGTSLATLLLPIGLLAAWRYYAAGHVNVKAAMVMAAAFFIGGLFGAQLAEKMSAIWLQRIFGLLLLAVAGRMILAK
ncbi:MAG TPA: sulfite exporter TauE/SafE family protein [Candidatus Edwardsbacteria bacterium]|nr:sulfite exporter TauE/SafE family protein [Candidatus Edwardsbacteria bacterium]